MGCGRLLYAAELAVLRVGSEPGLLDSGAVTAAMDLRQAVEELEWFHPDLGTGAAAIDLGPVTGGGDNGRAVVEELVNAALAITSVLVVDPALVVDDVLLLARVVTLIVGGHHHPIGRLP